MVRDSAVRIPRGSLFHHLGARTEKSLDVYLPLSLRDGGTSRAVLVDLSEQGVQGVMRALGYRKPVEGTQQWGGVGELRQECPSGIVNEDTFKQIYSQFFPQGDASTYAHYLFNAFDSGHNGSIKFEDFVTALSILLRGSTQEKLQWTFNLYDINRDGYINKEGVCEMMDIVSAIYDMMGKYTYPALKIDTPKQHVDAFFQKDKDANLEQDPQVFICLNETNLLNDHFNSPLQKMDKNRDGVVTLDEFILSCQEDDNIMRSLQLFENVI
ncbi:hypothetical protein QTP86_019002 [Hemibagrus guttatus]|nr:hypothetical protein QTP86_019002 [Hemibagrus guttatus]